MKTHQDEKPLKDKEDKTIPLTAAARLNILCDHQVDKDRTHQSEGHEPQINSEMSKGTQLYFKSNGIINVNNLQEQVHRDTHEGGPNHTSNEETKVVTGNIS